AGRARSRTRTASPPPSPAAARSGAVAPSRNAGGEFTPVSDRFGGRGTACDEERRKTDAGEHDVRDRVARRLGELAAEGRTDHRTDRPAGVHDPERQTLRDADPLRRLRDDRERRRIEGAVREPGDEYERHDLRGATRPRERQRDRDRGDEAD